MPALDLRRVGDVIGAAEHAPPVSGRLTDPVLHALAALVPSDAVTYLDLEPDATTVHAEDSLDTGVVLHAADAVTEPESGFWRHYRDALLCSYPTRTGDHRTVVTRSDFYSQREWRATGMWSDVARGVDFELLCPLPSSPGRSRRIVFFRTGSHDFTDEERLALAVLRPHLAEAMARRASAAELTERQTELMRLVAAGRSNAEIAVALHLSPHTVRTHLQNIFERLGVTTRAAAVARVLAGA